MATYIALANFTDKGMSSIKETTKRADAVKEMASKLGVRMQDIYWTLGQYDIVILCEAPDDAAITAFGLAVASAGNVRMQTLKAFSKDEMNAILGKMG
jgi:uncharacterized protein with GYD domain